MGGYSMAANAMVGADRRQMGADRRQTVVWWVCHRSLENPIPNYTNAMRANAMLFAVRCYEVGWVGGWKIPLPKHT